MQRFIFLVFGVFCITSAAFSQESIFGLHAVIGANASQISGDELAGFDKVSITGGLRGTAAFSENASLNIELLYSGRGSRPDIFNDIADPDINVTLRYLELPVYVSYNDWYDETLGYHKAYGAAGLSYGRLIEASTFDHYNTGDADLDGLVDSFSENDLSWMLGFGFRLTKHFMISARYTRSITLLLNAPKQGLDRYSLRSYFLTFRGEYVF